MLISENAPTNFAITSAYKKSRCARIRCAVDNRALRVPAPWIPRTWLARQTLGVTKHGILLTVFRSDVNTQNQIPSWLSCQCNDIRFRIEYAMICNAPRIRKRSSAAEIHGHMHTNFDAREDPPINNASVSMNFENIHVCAQFYSNPSNGSAVPTRSTPVNDTPLQHRIRFQSVTTITSNGSVCAMPACP